MEAHGSEIAPTARLTEKDLRADCDRCAGLCCVAPTLVQSDDFAIDKPAGQPCPNLGDNNRCEIYESRAEEGFRGCIVHDCNGAGQRVTQQLFGGRSWRDDPSILPAMSEAFFSLREIHGFLAMLRTAAKADLNPPDRRTLEDLVDELDPSGGWTVETLLAYEQSDTATETKAFLKSLRPYFEGRVSR